jgi:hypothetical protein
MITSPSTPAGVRLKAIEQVIKLNGLSASAQGQSDQNELASFLRTVSVGGDVNINVGNPFAGNIAAYAQGQYEAIEAHVTPGNRREVIEGAFTEAESETV